MIPVFAPALVVRGVVGELDHTQNFVPALLDVFEHPGFDVVVSCVGSTLCEVWVGGCLQGCGQLCNRRSVLGGQET
jgi:hypothetical protein